MVSQKQCSSSSPGTIKNGSWKMIALLSLLFCNCNVKSHISSLATRALLPFLSIPRSDGSESDDEKRHRKKHRHGKSKSKTASPDPSRLRHRSKEHSDCEDNPPAYNKKRGKEEKARRSSKSRSCSPLPAEHRNKSRSRTPEVRFRRMDGDDREKRGAMETDCRSADEGYGRKRGEGLADGNVGLKEGETGGWPEGDTQLEGSAPGAEGV